MSKQDIRSAQKLPLAPLSSSIGSSNNNSNESPGAMLRAARQAASVNIDVLAFSLKVSVSKLQALESDNFSVFPDTVFARSLAASVCRVLKIDSAPVLALMPQENKYRLPENYKGINTAFRGNFGGHSIFWRVVSYFKNPMALAVIALLIGASILLLLPYTPENSLIIGNSSSSDGGNGNGNGSGSGIISNTDSTQPTSVEIISTPKIAQKSSEPTAPVALPSSPASASAILSKANIPILNTTKETNNPIVAASSIPTLASSVATRVTTIATTASTTGSIATVGTPSGVLVFKARSSSWVKVRDSIGATIFQRTLATGESVAVPSTGNLPWSVVVGRADATEVYVRGTLLDVLPVSRENIAKFEVK